MYELAMSGKEELLCAVYFFWLVSRSICKFPRTWTLTPLDESCPEPPEEFVGPPLERY